MQINLRNYWKIGSKLTQELKIQLVHAGVLSNIEFAMLNQIFRSYKSYKTMLLYLFLDLKAKHVNNLFPQPPYLKKLHFLSVRFRIKYKIALLTYKCLNNMAPKYMTELLILRQSKVHNVRLDNDYYLLEPIVTNLRKSKAAFYCISTFSVERITILS